MRNFRNSHGGPGRPGNESTEKIPLRKQRRRFLWQFYRSPNRRNHCCCSTSPEVIPGGWVLTLASAVPRNAAIEDTVCAVRISLRRILSSIGAARFHASTERRMSAGCNPVIVGVCHRPGSGAAFFVLPESCSARTRPPTTQISRV